MANKIIVLFFTTILVMFGACVDTQSESGTTNSPKSSTIPYDDTRPGHWPEPFEVVEIPSTLDTNIQRAWYHPTSDTDPKPLLISLHTWSGDYNQKDTLAMMAVKKNWNYIHPDFRGPNWTAKACCSDFVMNDIDAAIDFAIENGPVDTSRIYVNGVSGGGYAALAVYMRSRHTINTISAWVPISDLSAWYGQSLIRGNNYATHILQCTDSENGTLDKEEAERRSPLFWVTPERNTKLYIYAGVYDGTQGSVPITQSINFYNKLARDIGVGNPDKMVAPNEIVWLLEHRKPFREYGMISDRAICLKKNFNNITLVIFEGKHEMLPETAFRSIQKNH